MFKKRYDLITALFELTLRCNMQCLHCGSSAGTKRIKELTTDEWVKVVKDLSDLDCKYIALLGGEPLLRKDWFEISKQIKEYGLELTIISNGFLIDKKMISKLKKLDLYTLAISLDGANAETHDKIRQTKGSFERCKNALSLSKNSGINTTAITTLNRINLKDLPLMRSFLLGKGIAWQLQIASPFGRFPKEIMLSKEEFYSAAMFISTTRRKYTTKELPIMGAHCFGYHSKYLTNVNIIPIWKGCQAGISTIGVQSDGGVKGCLSTPDNFIEGNVRKMSLSEIWNSDSFASYNRRFKKDDLNGDCVGCKYGRTCKGGCLSVSTAVTGENHADPYCFKLIEESDSFRNLANR